MERKFHEDLERLKEQLLSMSAKVERNIGDAIEALIRRDRKLAEDVRERDPEIDLAEIQIDEHCLDLLALHQPVARDLRFITTALKIVKDLERIGDHAKDISKQALAVMSGLPPRNLADLPDMANAAQRMLKRALDAFVNHDVELAQEVIKGDVQVDQLHDRILNELIDLMVQDPETIGPLTHLIYINKYLERIGDHSCNVAEMVVFMVEGKDIRHLEKIRKLTG